MPGGNFMKSRLLQRIALFSILTMIATFCAPAMAQSAGTLALTGDELVDEGKYEEALSYYEQAIALEPSKLPLAWAGKGVALNGLGRYEEALVAFDKAIALNPSYAKAYYQRGEALYGLKRYKDAITAYDTALAVNPQYGYYAYYGKAKSLAALGDYTAAIPLYEKALGLEPRYAEPWAMKGDALAATGDYQGAITAYEQSLSIEPNYILAIKGRDAAAANITRAAPGTMVSPMPTITTAPVTTAIQTQTTAPPTTAQGIPLSPWLGMIGIAAAVYLSMRKT
jgi:tetratricopeptide (TPR) repeat protein